MWTKMSGGATTTDARDEGHGKGELKGDKTGGKFKKKGKPAASDRSFATNRTPVNYQGKFWTPGGNNNPG